MPHACCKHGLLRLCLEKVIEGDNNTFALCLVSTTFTPTFTCSIYDIRFDMCGLYYEPYESFKKWLTLQNGTGQEIAAREGGDSEALSVSVCYHPRRQGGTIWKVSLGRWLYLVCGCVRISSGQCCQVPIVLLGSVSFPACSLRVLDV